MKPKYSEKLKDPRWADLSKRIHGRDICCVQCGSKEDLHVHHSHYRKGRDPWEYRDSDLFLLCAKCHRKIHSIEMLTEEEIQKELEEGLQKLNLVIKRFEIGEISETDALLMVQELNDKADRLSKQSTRRY